MDNNISRRKVFVSAYACEPGLGSEIGVGWHWVLEMSRFYDLWVLTRQSNRATIEGWMKENSAFVEKNPHIGRIRFLYYDMPKWARFWKRGLRGVRTYYNLWQWLSNGIVRRTMKQNGIEVFHHITYGNVLWKVSSYGSRKFFVWGPVGGLETIPKEYSDSYARRSRIIESVRRGVVKMLPLNLGFRRRCRRANLILCKTDITRQHIPAHYRNKALLFTDVAVEASHETVRPIDEAGNYFTDFIVVGRLDAWRGFDIAIEALAKALKQNPRLRLTIVGKGADKERLQALVKQLGVSGNVEFAGKVTMDEYRQILAGCDAVVNPALKEGAVTVAFDCLAMGKPLICLDTTGYTRYFSDEYAVVIPSGSRNQVVDDFSKAMLKLANPATRRAMGDAALSAGDKFDWENRGREIYNAIETAINNTKS